MAMKLIVKEFLIADLLYTHFGGKVSFADLLKIASVLVFISETEYHWEESQESRDLVDDFKNPFEILEHELKMGNLGYDVEDWELTK